MTGGFVAEQTKNPMLKTILQQATGGAVDYNDNNFSEKRVSSTTYA